MDPRVFHPMLDAAGHRMLARLRDHRSAPTFTSETGSRLNANELAWVDAQSERIAGATISIAKPGWLADYVTRAHEVVPYFRARARKTGALPAFEQIAPTCRAVLARDISQFVPDDAALEGLIAYETSGITGHPLRVPSHPTVAALYLAHHRRALRMFGVELQHGNDHVAAVLLGMQQRCFTYVSVVPMLGGAGFAKINLHPQDWRTPQDRSVYLNELSPQLISGDPVSFMELLRMAETESVAVRPDALLSTSMALSTGLRSALEARFQCPVVDVYSCNETGPIAVYDSAAAGHVLLQPDLYVEIVDRDGLPVPDGERGEITVTGGFNHMLALVRYRTGDYAARVVVGNKVVLRELSGRAPVRFATRNGRWLNNHEIGHAIRDIVLAQFSFHQERDGSCVLSYDGSPSAGHRAASRLAEVTGYNVRAEPSLVEVGTKMMQYTTAFTDTLREIAPTLVHAGPLVNAGPQ